MPSREEIKTVWLNAYNAALTGLLASRQTSHEPLKPDASTISDYCVTCADKAVLAGRISDLLKF
jgi:hypothetical protein